MSQSVHVTLAKLAWVGACIHSSAQILLVLRLPFCGPNVTDHYFCDTQPFLKLAYIDTYVINLLIVFNSGAICMVSFTLLLISYVFILHSMSNFSTEEGGKPFPHVPPTSLLLSYSLYHVYTYMLAL